MTGSGTMVGPGDVVLKWVRGARGAEGAWEIIVRAEGRRTEAGIGCEKLGWGGARHEERGWWCADKSGRGAMAVIGGVREEGDGKWHDGWSE